MQPILVHDDLWLTAERAVVHRPTQTAVIADVHLGYDEVRRRGGEAIPATGMKQTLVALRGLLRYGVRQLVIAGDLCEDARRVAPVADFLEEIRALGLRLVAVVPGNHDRGLERAETSLPLCGEGYQLGDWRVVHGDGRLPAGPVIHGHVHPCVRQDGVTAPCYLIAQRRLVLPAFSADAAGVNVLSAARWRSYRCVAIAGDRLLDFGGLARIQARRRRSASKARTVPRN
jgi:putative SbcD/Mre11-related phosphoesterase